MKKLITLALIPLLCMACWLPPLQEQTLDWMGDDVDRIGRLWIPSAYINVGLEYSYASWEWQGIVDRQDSACIYMMHYGCYTIADHNNQAFADLESVEVGDNAYLLQGHGYIKLVCVAVFDGHNDGTYITDADGNDVQGRYDYICYTCRDNWRNVLIVAFEVI